MIVTLFIPCFVDVIFPRAGISMVEILERLGHKVVCPGRNRLLRPAAVQLRLLGRSARRRRESLGAIEGRGSHRHRFGFVRRDVEEFLSRTVQKHGASGNWRNKSRRAPGNFPNFSSRNSA